MHCNLWGFSTDWYQLGSVRFCSVWDLHYTTLQLVAIATKHSEKQHEQSALSWGKQPGIITIVSMDEIKGILFLILGLWLFEMCWSALSLNLRKTLKITIMTQSPCYNNNDRSKVFTVGTYLYKYNLTVLFVSPSKIAHDKFYIYCPPLLLNEIYTHAYMLLHCTESTLSVLLELLHSRIWNCYYWI